MMVLMALSSITVEQAKATEQTMERCTQLLDYLAGHVDTKIRFHVSNMIMNIHLDALYLSELKAHSRACGHLFLGWMPKDDEPVCLNGAFYVSTMLLWFVVASAAEVELEATFTTIVKQALFFDSPSATWVNHNQKLLSSATMPRRWESRTTPSKRQSY